MGKQLDIVLQRFARSDLVGPGVAGGVFLCSIAGAMDIGRARPETPMARGMVPASATVGAA
ncbi:MAG TPA: hypothetical protein VFC78_25275 [Tepidisphaeraceae bacterium]|nr:hypothetical protein [Tepidisphaeraceae bacterium]